MALTFDKVQNQTIAAIATGMSESGIGIIRISGPDSDRIIDRIYRTPGGKRRTEWKSHTIHYGYIVDPESGEKIDEVLVSWMKSPHTYTTEDTAEINTHGGIYVMKRVLSAVLDAGARMAEPGEFTKRAFLGGRIDLAEAEAVMNLIRSQNEFSRRTSLAQLNGSVSNEVKRMRSEILYEIARIESALDDPDNYSLEGYPQHLKRICNSLIDRLNVLIRNSKEGRILREGIRAVIVGKPNAGKSSLMNALSGTDRAIVTEIAGTTRDTLEETVRIDDILLNITDTAGIHETEDPVEKIGVDRARNAMNSAQLIFFVIDSSVRITDEDRIIADTISNLMQDGTKCIVLMNKSDLRTCTTGEEAVRLFSRMNVSDIRLIPVCLKSVSEPAGIDVLKNTISEMFHLGEIAESSGVLLAGDRELQEAQDALHSLELVTDSIDNGMSEDFFTIDLQNAYSSLGSILGEAVEDDLVDEIFSKFCLGK